MEALKSDGRVKAFKATDAFAVEAYRAVTSMHKRMGTGLAEEIRRTVVAAGGAIVAASACGAGDDSERAYLRRARTALFESRYYLHLARRFGWLDAKRYRALTLRQDAAVRELNSLLEGSNGSAGRAPP